MLGAIVGMAIMKSRILLLALVLTASAPALAKEYARTSSDAQIKAELIRRSIESYPGNCPCPYNSASNGNSCGRRSAYSRGGGYAPLCYAKDVTAAMVEEYRFTPR